MEKQVNPLVSHWLKVSEFINKVPTGIFMFATLAIAFLSPSLDANEEQYMQLAKQFVDPTWIPQSINLTEAAGTRILYQWIIGHALKFFSFEVTKLIFGLGLTVGFSIGLRKIYKLLSLGNHHFLVHLGLFLFFEQSFFAGSWMLISVEPKGFAYLFVLYSFYYLLTNRWNGAFLLLMVASYLHILVGFYSFAYLLLTLLLFKNYHQISLRKLGFLGFLYAMLLIPFVIYLKTTATDYSMNSEEVLPSWIYTYFRSPHHTALVPDLKYFFKEHFFGILNALVALFASLLIYSECRKNKIIAMINQFVMVSLAGTLLLVSIAFLDKNGVILKFYLYRINTLSTFFITLLLAWGFFEIVKQYYFKKIQVLVLMIFSVIILKTVLLNFYSTVTYTQSLKNLNALSDFIRLNTDSQSLIFNFDENLALVRKTERNFFVVYKYIPAQLSKINDWYNRVLEKNEAIEFPSKMGDLINKYGIAYLIAPKEKKGWTDYPLIYENEDYLLFETGVKTSTP